MLSETFEQHYATKHDDVADNHSSAAAAFEYSKFIIWFH